MTKKRLLIALPGLVIVLLFALFLLQDDRADGRQAACGLGLGPNLRAALGAEAGGSAMWQVYAQDGRGIAPDIRVAALDDAQPPPAGAGRGCALEVVALSPDGTRDTDWRIGHRIDLTALQGRTLRATFYLRAAQPARLPEAEVYLHDGSTVRGEPTHRIDTDWTAHTVTLDTAPDATELELWFRPFHDTGTARPARNTLFLAVALKEYTADDRAVEDAAALYSSGQYRQAECATGLPPGIAATAGTAADGAGGAAAPDLWVTYATAGTGPEPGIAVTAAAAGTPGCRLILSDAGPAPGAAGRDLRIGRAVPVADLRGRRVTFAADLRADRPARLGDAYLYVHDGRTTSATRVRTVGTDWSRVAVEHPVPPDAPVLQVWLRLLFGDAAVEPGDLQLDFAPQVTLAPAP
ncbi:hypothetical protein ACFOGJ_24815 [Marinibaculum pumilum]|uniref:CBM-cenC domain-containing protein n=1 Tax=Marinibaculum pumilum TaxID=1766165 RepID=A0ABV7L7I6_9PROT